MNIYVELTKEFNRGRLRTIICSGQAVVLHRLAVMSKDGDWIIHEDEESVNYILNVLAGYGARYRFGAPLDIRWLKGGWSSHFEFRYNDLRVRTDFFSRPPRISSERLKKLWKEQETSALPFVNVLDLAELKKTNREKDYAVIGELARLMSNPRHQLLYTRSARDILKLAEEFPESIAELAKQRPLLSYTKEGREKLEELLDKEKRTLIRQNENRLALYLKAAEEWTAKWPSTKKKLSDLPIFDAHKMLIKQAKGILPFDPGDIEK
jgi:hypothetical protein